MDERPAHTHRSSQLFRLIFPLAFASAAFLLLSVTLSAQTIRMVRTDVDSGRSSFITATQMFGVDIVLDSVTNVTGVSFQLRYNNANVVTYSNYKARDLGREGAFVYDLSDPVAGTGKIIVGMLSGRPITDEGFNNPRALHLDFVVRPSAKNNDIVTFTFLNAEATSSDSGGRLVPLTSINYQVNIHGFVNVFPGDANNDGKVDERDFNATGLYSGQGSGLSNVRGYRREPASTFWKPQPALVWDSAGATYADCDGSGDVTLSDGLVVRINLDSLHSGIMPGDEDPVGIRTPVAYPEQSVRVPLTFTSSRAVNGIALRVRTHGGRLLGCTPAAGVELNHCGRAGLAEEQATGTNDYILILGPVARNTNQQIGSAGWLIAENAATQIEIIESFGSTLDHSFFPLGGITTVESGDATPGIRISPNPASEYLHIHLPDAIVQYGHTLIIRSMLGEEVYSTQLHAADTMIPVATLGAGMYSATVRTPASNISLPFVIVR
ncbi:MAG: T9SS type A sorting domain-containing protein [Candidatus Kapabacteria bacterium]|nr:T9SS type A sorting domain-containing protein [Candidatus Kapabacteria bacterium]